MKNPTDITQRRTETPCKALFCREDLSRTKLYILEGTRTYMQAGQQHRDIKEKEKTRVDIDPPICGLESKRKHLHHQIHLPRSEQKRLCFRLFTMFCFPSAYAKDS